MEFIIKYGDKVQDRVLTYVSEEYSFDMEPFFEKYDFELAVNKLTLSVVNDTVIQITGFCGLNHRMASSYQVPEFKKGSLKVKHNLKHGFVYDIRSDSDYEFPENVNVQTGWVCIGNPIGKGRGVEFINNCVAFIDDKNEFVSLWLKPQKLPTLV